MPSLASDVAFTPAVKVFQTRRGSHDASAKREVGGGFRTEITDDLIAFLAEVNTAYLATASAEGQPYAQHRGGPRGFIRVVGGRTLGFADYRATGSTSRPAICPRTTKRFCSSWTTRIVAGSKSGAARASSGTLSSSRR